MRTLKRLEIEIRNAKLLDLHNFCIENNFEVEIRNGKVFLQIAEITMR